MAEEKPPKPPARDWADFIDTGRKWQRAFAGLIIVLVLAAIAGAYFYKHKTKPANTTKSTTATQTAPAKITAETKSYSSPNFYLSINYPKDWTLTDSGGGVMTIISPPVGLKASSGQELTSLITLSFKNSGQALPEFDKGNATAAIDSLKIAYTYPSQTQRANTYLSFLTYSATAGSGIDGVYITGDFGYKKDQAIPKVDIQKIDPIVNLTFARCSDGSCSGKTVPISIAVSTWNDPKISQPLIKMLESLTFS